jgi:WD40 repeat protein
VLGVAWSKDGTKVFTCSTDQKAKVFDLNSPGSQPMQIAQHDGPISCMRYLDISSGAGMPPGIVVTGSWDKTVRVSDSIWDGDERGRQAMLRMRFAVLGFTTIATNLHTASQGESARHGLGERPVGASFTPADATSAPLQLTSLICFQVFGTADRNIHVVKLAQPHVIRNVCAVTVFANFYVLIPTEPLR